MVLHRIVAVFHSLVILGTFFFFTNPPSIEARGIQEVRKPSIESVDPKSDLPLPTDPLLIRGTLPNGLTYFIRRNLRPANRAELHLVVHAGSVLEEDDQQGLAHYLEHMAFNGTARFPKDALVNWLESIGMRFGPETNAYTSFDETVYQLQVPLDDPQYLRTALEILYDWAFQITLSEEEVERERGVILEEWRLGRGAVARIRDKQFPILLKGSRYAERLPIGIPEVIKAATAESLRRFYQAWYRPELMALIVVGDFFPAEVENLIWEKFSPETPRTPEPKAPPMQNQRVRPLFTVPPHPQTLVSIATDPELTRASVGIYVKQDWQAPQTYRDFRAQLVEQIFFSILNTRFSEISRREGAPFIIAGAGSATPIRPTNLLYLAASSEEGGIETALHGLAIEARRIQLHGVSSRDVEQAKAEILRAAEQNLRQQNTIPSSSFVSAYVEAYLMNTPTLGPEYSYRVIRKLIPGITPAEVARIASPFLEPANRVILVSAPEREGPTLPTESELLAKLLQATHSKPEPFTEEPPITTLLPTPPAGTLQRVQTSLSNRYRAVEWSLGNGARVVLKTTDFKQDEVLFSSFALGGTSLAEEEDYLSATFGPDIVGQSGLAQFTSTQLERYLQGKVLSLTPSVDEVALRFRGSSSIKDLETFFQLLHLYFTAPRYDEDAVQRYIDQVRSSLRNEENSPETRFSWMVQEHLRNGHPRSLPFTLQQLNQVDPRKAYKFFLGHVSRPEAFTFVFVGDITPEQLEPYLKQYLASLPRSEVPFKQVSDRVGTILDRGVRYNTQPAARVLRAGKEEKSLVSLFINGSWDWSLEEMSYLQFLEDYLDIRLREVLREDIGGTYDVGISIIPRRAPVPEYTMEISFGTSPARVEELVRLFRQELQRLHTVAPSEGDVAKVREQRIRLVERGRRENAFWRAFLTQELYFAEVGAMETLPGTIFDLWEQTAKNLTPQDLKQRIRTYLSEDRILQFVLLPE